MVKKEYQPYTYLVGWSKLDKWYYGCQYAYVRKIQAHPNNLWTTYFTSSKIVKKFRECHGEPDVIQIRKIFDNEKQARLWEEKVLRRMKAVTSDRWMNKCYGAGKLGNSMGFRNGMFGKKQSELCKEVNRKLKEKYLYRIIYLKTGVEFTTKNLRQFCREHRLSRTGLQNTITGKSRQGKTYSQHKGFKVVLRELLDNKEQRCC